MYPFQTGWPCPDPYTEIENPDDRPTWPPPGTSQLVIEDRCLTLFLTKEWTIVALLNGIEFSLSDPKLREHQPAEIATWTRDLIKTRYAELRRFGVDADGEYVKWGGNIIELRS